MLIALCGKPSSGKSTFFKAATLSEVDIASYPFTTLKSSEGVGFIKVKCVEKEFNIKCKPKHGFCLDGYRFIPIRLMDVPGLIPGSHKGLGMGNQFLDELRQADAFIHVVDISGSVNEKGEAVEKLSYDPVKDVKFLEEELDFWFLGLIKKNWDKFVRQVKQDSLEVYKAVAKQLSGLKVSEEICKEVLKKYNSDLSSWSEDELVMFSRDLRVKSKPMIIAANKVDISSENLDKIDGVGCSAEVELGLREAAKKNLIKYVPGESKFEIIGELTALQKKGLEFVKKFLDKNGSTGIQEVLNSCVFELLNKIVVYPVANNKLSDKDGNVLPDCYMVDDGISASEFAYFIHSDIGEKFVKGVDMKTKMVIGKDHKLKNGDVIEIIT